MHIPALATRAAITATATAAAALVGVLPALNGVAAPTAAPTAAPAAAPEPAVTPAAPVNSPATVELPVETVALSRPSAVGARAVGHAMSKLGAPYRWGATGPNAFDCSGLVSWAYKNAGVSLPRNSRAMSRVGRPVAKSDLRPGDLVFFYRPVSHVGIYIGGGKVVNAVNSRTPVKVSNINAMPFNGARRI
ncbi:C40 family peptidase [Pseudonocardia xinjiangensis]|uniref:C40 family peptidase n=1 Tax=Pseudonocardia xinjiangensis TaxID=75289 RepID=UPI003D926507